MLKLIIIVVAVLLVSSFAQTIDSKIENPVLSISAKQVTFEDIFPKVDKYLRTTYWYYLRDAKIIYQANLNTQNEFMFFVFYRNIAGTFLVITTWDKSTLNTEVNTFVRLGNGFAVGSQALYSPVSIDPYLITLKLKQGQYMVIINEDGTIKVIGKKPKAVVEQPKFDIQKDMKQKGLIVDKDIRQKYWYYLNEAILVHGSNVPTSKRYYYVSIYVNIVGTFLVISEWDRNTETSQVATFVRLGDGYKVNSQANYEAVKFEPITLSPAILQVKFNN